MSLEEYHQLPFRLVWKQEYINGHLEACIKTGKEDEAWPWRKWRGRRDDG